jgi:hypothetical protein
VPDFSVTALPDAAPAADMAPAGDMNKPAAWQAGKSETTRALRGVWVADAALSTVYLVGHEGTILKGGAASFMAEMSGTTESLYAVLGVSAEEAYAVGGRGTILHRQGGKWIAEGKDLALTVSLFGLAIPDKAQGDVLAVGDGGTVVRRSGGAWKIEAGPDKTDLRAAWGKDASEVYAVGLGSIWRRANNAWTVDSALQAADKGNFYAVTGLDGVPFVAGEYGAVLRREGGKWVAEPTIKPAPMMGVPPHFYGIYASGGEVFAVGLGGAVQARAPVMAMGMPRWSQEVSMTGRDLFAVAGGGARAIVAVGDGGALVRRQ